MGRLKQKIEVRAAKEAAAVRREQRKESSHSRKAKPASPVDKDRGKKELRRLRILHRLLQDLQEQMRMFRPEGRSRLHVKSTDRKLEKMMKSLESRRQHEAFLQPWEELLTRAVNELQMELATNQDKLRSFVSKLQESQDQNLGLPALARLVKIVAAINVKFSSYQCAIAGNWPNSLAANNFSTVFDFLESDYPVVTTPWGCIISPSGYMSMAQNEAFCEAVGIGEEQTKVFQSFYLLLSRLEDLLGLIMEIALCIDRDISLIKEIYLVDASPRSKTGPMTLDPEDVGSILTDIKRIEKALLGDATMNAPASECEAVAYLVFTCIHEAMAWLQNELYVGIADSSAPMLNPWQASELLRFMQRRYSDARTEDLLHRTRLIPVPTPYEADSDVVPSPTNPHELIYSPLPGSPQQEGSSDPIAISGPLGNVQDGSTSMQMWNHSHPHPHVIGVSSGVASPSMHPASPRGPHGPLARPDCPFNVGPDPIQEFVERRDQRRAARGRGVQAVRSLELTESGIFGPSSVTEGVTVPRSASLDNAEIVAIARAREYGRRPS